MTRFDACANVPHVEDVSLTEIAELNAGFDGFDGFGKVTGPAAAPANVTLRRSTGNSGGNNN